MDEASVNETSALISPGTTEGARVIVQEDPSPTAKTDRLRVYVDVQEDGAGTLGMGRRRPRLGRRLQD